MSKFKRWYYELTEKQVKKIAFVVAFIGTILFIIFAIIRFGPSIDTEIGWIFIISLLFLVPITLGVMVYSILWDYPPKQSYLFKKQHDNIIVPDVRKKFVLGPEFKEVLYSPIETDYDFINFLKVLNELEVKYFAEEINGVILISVRSKDGKELELHKIENYNFFDLNFKPKE